MIQKLDRKLQGVEKESGPWQRVFGMDEGQSGAGFRVCESRCRGLGLRD